MSQIECAMKHYTGKVDLLCFGEAFLQGFDALCGDLWEFPERFQTEHPLIWPVYVDYTVEEWNDVALDEYAAQAALAAEDVLMINPIDEAPVNHGGVFHFHKGQIKGRIPFDEEDVLIVEI
ncbi:MAG: hypothetical protein IJ744_02620 [Lachnospiraceae bacterium]|nr:hypothetical protein [Lachnospiraceae bacterium]